MTIDRMIMNPVAYEESMKQLVRESVYRIYEDLSNFHIDSTVVRLNDLIEFTYSDIYIHERDHLISESVSRGDYELYGLSQDQYLVDVYNGSIEDEAVIPFLDKVELYNEVIRVISESHLFFENEHDEFENEPLREVW